MISKSQSKEETTYYIKDGYVHSNSSKEFILPQILELENFTDNEDKDHFNQNKKILYTLTSILDDNSKTLSLPEKISDFDSLKSTLEEFHSQGKLKTVEEDNYEFIEKTASLDIIEQILLSIKDPKFDSLKKTVHDHVKKFETHEEKLLSKLKKEIINYEKKLDEENNSLQELEEQEMKVLNKKLNTLEKERKERVEYIELLNLKLTQSNKSIPNTLQKLEKELTKQKFLIEDAKFELKLLKTRLDNLKEEKKSGRRKKLTPLSTLLTLGLIYFTKFSSIDHHIMRTTHKVNKQKEKILEMERKVAKTNFNHEEEVSISKNKEKVIRKQMEKVQQAKDDAHLKEKEQEKEFVKLEKEKEKIVHKIEKLKDEFKVKEEALTDLKIKEENYKKISCIKILDVLHEITRKRDSTIQEIISLKQAIENQRVSFEGSYSYNKNTTP